MLRLEGRREGKKKGEGEGRLGEHLLRGIYLDLSLRKKREGKVCQGLIRQRKEGGGED